MVVGALVVLALLLPSPDWVIPAVLLHAGSRGAVAGTVSAFMWEVLGRGVSSHGEDGPFRSLLAWGRSSPSSGHLAYK